MKFYNVALLFKGVNKMLKTRLSLTIILLLLIALLLLISLPVNAQVNPHQVYTYEQMTEDIIALQETYPEIIEYRSIGQSHQGREIWAVKLGTGTPNIFINGSHHGREWISTNIVMYMLNQYAKSCAANETIDGYNAKEILTNVSIWFVPMVNPDGVTLQQLGIDTIKDDILRKNLVRANNGSLNFKRWKTNIMGVDPNKNYPFNWQHVRDCPGQPSFASYKGTAPLTEPENIAMINFTYEIRPEIAVSYHSSGRVIFYPADSPRLDIAQNLSTLTGYAQFPLSHYAGGYTDWFVREFDKPAYTPELSYHVGPTNPPLSIFNEEWQRNKSVGLYLAQEAYDIWIEQLIESPTVAIYYNEQKIYFPDTQPKLLTNTTYAPARTFAESLNIGVKWENGNLYLIQNGKLTKTHYFLLNNRAMVPVTAITRIANMNTFYEDNTIWIRKEEDTIIAAIDETPSKEPK